MDAVADAARLAQDGAEEPESGGWTMAALGTAQVPAMPAGTAATRSTSS